MNGFMSELTDSQCKSNSYKNYNSNGLLILQYSTQGGAIKLSEEKMPASKQTHLFIAEMVERDSVANKQPILVPILSRDLYLR